jgi:hypothetical protein
MYLSPWIILKQYCLNFDLNIVDHLQKHCLIICVDRICLKILSETYSVVLLMRPVIISRPGAHPASFPKQLGALSLGGIAYRA